MSGKPKSPTQYADMVIAHRGTTPVRLGDVAVVRDTIAERRSLAPSTANRSRDRHHEADQGQHVSVVDGVTKAIEALQREMPTGTEIQIVRDTSVFIREAVDDVENSLVLGGLLTIVIVFVFLNSWRSTVITGLTLPISVIATFMAVYMFGFTLNFLTLMALSLCIGLLIDDAIVVRENIVRHLGMGKDHHTAAREGTDEIGLAVMATTFTIVAVFVPVAFMGGIIGKFFASSASPWWWR